MKESRRSSIRPFQLALCAEYYNRSDQRYFFQGKSLSCSVANPVRQAAVVALHRNHICLVLSSSGRRWVLPKGSIEPGETSREAALREAWEEAGLIGEVCRAPTGSYTYHKNGLVHHVTVYLMVVHTVASHWPECHRRTRRWVAPASAPHCVKEPQLRRLLLNPVPQLPADAGATTKTGIENTLSDPATSAA